MSFKDICKKLKEFISCQKKAENPTLGKVTVGNRKLQEIKLISQGGYAYVYKVRDVATKEVFALKVMICQNEERYATAMNEIKILQSLPQHPNLLRFYDAQTVKRENGRHVFVLMEFCEDGSLFDLMSRNEINRLSEQTIISIMKEVSAGVRALHSANPPISHRDLKIENILIGNGKYKLCDYGSCSSKFVDFSKIHPSQYGKFEDEYDRNTTLMYRPPEMCDPYQKWEVNEKVDIWMLGCILFTLCFYKHPFQDEMSKLSIVNAAYTFPKEHKYNEKMLDFIRLMLTPNPKFRPSIHEVCDILENYYKIDKIPLNPEAERIKQEYLLHQQELQNFQKKAEERKTLQKKNEEVWIEFKESSKKSANTDAFDAFNDSKHQVDYSVNQNWHQFDFKAVNQNTEASALKDDKWGTPEFFANPNNSAQKHFEDEEKDLFTSFTDGKEKKEVTSPTQSSKMTTEKKNSEENKQNANNTEEVELLNVQISVNQSESHAKTENNATVHNQEDDLFA